MTQTPLLSDLTQRFLEFEEDMNLLDGKTSTIWEGIRWEINDRLNAVMNNLKPDQDSKIYLREHGIVWKFIVLVSVFLREVILIPRKMMIIHRHKGCKIFFVSGGRRKKESDGLFWDIYVDPLIEVIGQEDYLLMEDAFRGKHLVPAKTGNVIYQTHGYITAVFAELKVLKNPNVGFERDYKNIEAEFNTRFSTGFDIEELAKRYHRSFISRYNQDKRLLKSLKPQMVCMVCGYGREPMVRAAKDLNIPVVELQHGVISKLHLGYNVGNGQKANFSDYFFTFGPKWNEGINFPIPDNRIITIGYKYLSDSAEKLKEAPKLDQILFISQGTIGDRLSKFAVELLKLKPDYIKVLYKLHPGETLRWTTAYPELKQESDKGNLTVIAGDEPSLYKMMAESKWQIGGNSTALYEGMMFKCRTFIVDFPGKEGMQELLDSGEFVLVKSPSEIDFSYDQNNLCYAIEEYFSANTEEKFLSAVEFVLKQAKRPR